MSAPGENDRAQAHHRLPEASAHAGASLDSITQLAQAYFEVPIALVSALDADRLLFKARQGLDLAETPLDTSFCRHTIANKAPLIVPDISLDERFAEHEWAKSPYDLKFHAGAPILVGGEAIGSVCVFDEKPRELDPRALEKLTMLAEMAARFLSEDASPGKKGQSHRGLSQKELDHAVASAEQRHRDSVDSKNFLELILRSIPDVMFVKDANFRIIQANPAFFNLFPEETHDTLLGTTGMSEFEPHEVDAYLVNDREAFEKGYAEATEAVTVLGGETQIYQSKKIRFEDNQGDPFILGIARNVTEQLAAEEQFAEVKNFQDLILENIPDPVYVKNAQGRVILANNAFLKLFPPHQRDKVLGSDAWSLLDDKELQRKKPRLYRLALTTGYAEAFDEHRHDDGTKRDFHFKKYRFENPAGEQFILAIARDITKEREAERRLNEAHEFQSLMLAQIPDLVFVKDEGFRIVEANQSFLNVYPEEIRSSVIGTTTLEQYDDEERDAFLEQDRLAFEKGFAETEESIAFPDGTRRVLLTKKVRFQGPDRKNFMLGIGRDITELVDVRRENEETRELLQNVFDTVTGAIIGLDNDRRILMINDAGRQMIAEGVEALPFKWPEAIGFLDPEDMRPLESSHDPISRALIGQKVRGEVHLMTSANSSDTHYVRVTSALVANEASPLRAVLVLDDVSEAERNRQQIERQSRLDALGQLTGGIAHDFNNLLNTMQYALALIGNDELSERGERSLAAALKSIGRGSELTNRLLAFAKKQPARSIALPVKSVFEELGGLVKPAIEASITVQFEEVSEELMVFCDQGQLQNAALNLILNSRDAILKEGVGKVIKIAAREVDALPSHPESVDSEVAIFSSEGRAGLQQEEEAREYGLAQRYIEISVTDDGPGMSKAVVARAIDPFFTTKQTNSGTGLGLSMVYGFVQQSEGEIRIYTEEGTGTTIKLYLPFGNQETGREEPVALEPTVFGNGETILVVEDEPYLLSQLTELLSELNYRPLKASSGAEALKLVESGEHFDLLLTDVVMPDGLGGFELARLVREIVPEVPIIYMSGYTGFTDEEMGEVKAALLPKPSSPAMTSAKIRSVLDNTNSL